MPLKQSFSSRACTHTQLFYFNILSIRSLYDAWVFNNHPILFFDLKWFKPESRLFCVPCIHYNGNLSDFPVKDYLNCLLVKFNLVNMQVDFIFIDLIDKLLLKQRQLLFFPTSHWVIVLDVCGNSSFCALLLVSNQ